MRYAISLILLAVLAAGCTNNGGTASLTGSANYQNCLSQCQAGNVGNGTYCKDGCRMTEAAATNNTAWCDQLDNPATRPSCYGTVAKSAGDIKICDRLSDSTDHKYCVSTFGAPGTS
jgi:hypothetical protein